VAAAALLATAGLWLLSSLAAIALFAFRYPAFDQFRLYTHYLGLDFPASALQLENGHRPVLPALVRIAEVRWLHADQTLQIGLGVALALLTLVLIATTAWRERRDAVAGASSVLLAVLAVFWLGNARLLMHGNELVHIYLVSASAVLALLSVRAACDGRPVQWMAFAGVLSLCATFSFGPGMASFAAMFLLAMVLRVPARAFAIPLLLFGAAIAFYVGALPGDSGVRGAVALRPMDNLEVLVRWLSAPWVHAWLGFAQPGVFAWNPGDTALERTLMATAQWAVVAPDGGGLFRAGAVIGGLGLAAYLFLLASALRSVQPMPALQSLALGLASFGLAVGAIISLARLGYFEAIPMQVFADRYLPWSCLFWLGIGLGLADHGGATRPWPVAALAPLLAMTLAVALLPSQRGQAGWSQAVHRNVAQSAVAAQLGLWDGERFPSEADASRAHVERSLALMREQRVAMFAEPAWLLVLDGWRAPATDAPTPAVAHVAVTRTFHDDIGDRQVAAFEGWVSAIEGQSRHSLLVVVDAAGAQRGLAKFSFVAPDDRGWLRLPAMRGFVGYVLEPRPGETLRVLVLDPRTRAVLAQVPLVVP
jgi:hypothetical protein